VTADDLARVPGEVPLQGGVANAGAVVRVGDHVVRPSNPHSGAIHAFLRAVRDTGFQGASLPIGVDPDGRERLEFVAGDVPLTPYPAWARSDTALVSVAELMLRFHRASAAVTDVLAEGDWSDEMADPEGGSIICHNDVCLENVVFRDGVAVALLDFDFCAPGRRVYDLAQFARMCVPIDDDVNASRLGWTGGDRPGRLRLVAEVHELDRSGREELLAALDASLRGGGEFVRRRVAAGDPNFIAMWHDMGGAERFDRRQRWWDAERHRFAAALGVGAG
jgi:hypothetical protein